MIGSFEINSAVLQSEIIIALRQKKSLVLIGIWESS